MLEARELLCERDERTLFSGLSFTLNAGEWVQITGSNGAGKTTLCNLLLRRSINRGDRPAYIVNEFGRTGIDAQLR